MLKSRLEGKGSLIWCPRRAACRRAFINIDWRCLITGVCCVDCLLHLCTSAAFAGATSTWLGTCSVLPPLHSKHRAEEGLRCEVMAGVTTAARGAPVHSRSQAFTFAEMRSPCMATAGDRSPVGSMNSSNLVDFPLIAQATPSLYRPCHRYHVATWKDLQVPRLQ